MRIDRLTPATQVLREFGRRLADVRKQQQWSQEHLAEVAGIGIATLRRIEDGKDARFGSWVRLLAALRLDGVLDQLLPEQIRSPMAEVQGQRRRTRKPPPGTPPDRGFVWGDERR